MPTTGAIRACQYRRLTGCEEIEKQRDAVERAGERRCNAAGLDFPTKDDKYSVDREVKRKGVL